MEPSREDRSRGASCRTGPCFHRDRALPPCRTRTYRPVYSSGEGFGVGSIPSKDHISESSEKISHKAFELGTTWLCYELLAC